MIRKFALVLAVALLAGCSLVGKVDKAVLGAHAAAVEDVTAENTRYVTADAALTDTQKDIRRARNAETAAFARKLVEEGK